MAKEVWKWWAPFSGATDEQDDATDVYISLSICLSACLYLPSLKMIKFYNTVYQTKLQQLEQQNSDKKSMNRKISRSQMVDVHLVNLVERFSLINLKSNRAKSKPIQIVFLWEGL